MKVRIVSFAERGPKVIISLACRHTVSVQKTIWQRPRNGLRHYAMHCPLCGGFK